MRYNSSETGRSMIEMLCVLAIVGILSTGGISAYSNAMAKHKLNKTTDQLTQVSFNIRNAFLNRRNYSGVENLNTLVALNVFPQEMISQETTTSDIALRAPQFAKKFDDSAFKATKAISKYDHYIAAKSDSSPYEMVDDLSSVAKKIDSLKEQIAKEELVFEKKEAVYKKDVYEQKKYAVEEKYSVAEKIDSIKEEIAKEELAYKDYLEKKEVYAEKKPISGEMKKITEDPIKASATDTVTTIRHAYSDYVDVYLADKNAENDKAAFVLTFSGLPDKACTSLVSDTLANDEGLLSVSINAKEDLTSHVCEAGPSVFCEDEVSIKVSDIASACNNKSNYVAFKYQ